MPTAAETTEAPSESLARSEAAERRAVPTAAAPAEPVPPDAAHCAAAPAAPAPPDAARCAVARSAAAPDTPAGSGSARHAAARRDHPDRHAVTECAPDSAGPPATRTPAAARRLSAAAPRPARPQAARHPDAPSAAPRPGSARSPARPDEAEPSSPGRCYHHSRLAADSTACHSPDAPTEGCSAAGCRAPSAGAQQDAWCASAPPVGCASARRSEPAQRRMWAEAASPDQDQGQASRPPGWCAAGHDSRRPCWESAGAAG